MKLTFSRFTHHVSRCFLVFTVAATLFITQPVSAQLVDIPDPNLRQAILEELELPENAPITQQEMLRLMTLEPGEKGITDLTGLKYATNLTSLLLYLNPIVDISPLSQLTKLRTIHFWGCNVVDLSPLRNLKNLTLIILANNDISDISPLAGLTNLIHLDLGGNRIIDVSPLANLTLLEKLWLNKNAITDVSPLIGLKNLKTLHLANNPFHDFSPLLELEGVELDIEISEEFDVVAEVLDPNLKQLIRETLSLPETLPLTQGQMQKLTELDAGGDRGITDLTGLEDATNLRALILYQNPIVDISPLSQLTKLKTIHFWSCRIVDLGPLRNLKDLRRIILGYNQISDISPLSELTDLTHLFLEGNHIVDYSPLVSLTHLEKLWINQNPGTDFTSLQVLNITEFRYDEVCEIPPPLPPVRERIENRSFPSIVQAWDDVVGLDHLTWEQRNVLHDLHFSTLFDNALAWDTTETEPNAGVATRMAGDLAHAFKVRQRKLDQNPNMVFLFHVLIHNHSTTEAFPPNSDFWLRDENGEILINSDGLFHINFLKPEVQDLLAKRIIAAARCGLYDGVFLDGAGANGGNRFVGRHFYTATNAEITQAMRNILGTVRANTRDDFLIVVNSNDNIVEGYPELVNGNFMETFKDHPGGYSHRLLKRLEYVLSWSEENLREPRVNCLEAQGMSIEPPDGPNNLRMMRAITTLSLTHSDGYVLYTTGFRDFGDDYPEHHDHLWHSFWAVDLGRPIGPKAQRYKDIPGLFIREFTNGWVVYNRSGKAQTISLPESATGVSSGTSGITHILPDLDGEMYLKAPNPADTNGDGRINVLDLVQVANGFGQSTPDPNGDGAVNILDLVFVAQQFSQ